MQPQSEYIYIHAKSSAKCGSKSWTSINISSSAGVGLLILTKILIYQVQSQHSIYKDIEHFYYGDAFFHS